MCMIVRVLEFWHISKHSSLSDVWVLFFLASVFFKLPPLITVAPQNVNLVRLLCTQKRNCLVVSPVFTFKIQVTHRKTVKICQHHCFTNAAVTAISHNISRTTVHYSHLRYGTVYTNECCVGNKGAIVTLSICFVIFDSNVLKCLNLLILVAIVNQ